MEVDRKGKSQDLTLNFLLLLALALVLPAWRGECFVLVITLSGLIAHAPGAVRGYRPWSPDGAGGTCGGRG